MRHYPGVYTIAETAVVLGISADTVRRLGRNGQLTIRLTTDRKRRYCIPADIRSYFKRQFSGIILSDEDIEQRLTEAAPHKRVYAQDIDNHGSKSNAD